ncbi:CaiB/BaiF CoA-transferase family protein [Psychromarinibacter sp. C21-152]|uniref:CaiB/BaiF CoA-transferase family protein n=1 Tax=Psychromarinibacter sediminicola TaxID=3033385 RepID=A0AAE3T7W8_9RHOB|nr:CaiB/BaiF CoA-transferase family protein [Psychromarinibacter sediminicola]MDF0600622.1 CaiB/BaiF CoA-transferase family protein [Psychromarinibacter sediminicola]
MLNGTRIVEIEGLGPGPFAAMHLADLGADVIVIHRKDGAVTPGMPERSILDRGKRSIALDLKSPEDVRTARDLIATADGLVEGFRPGVMERLGLGPEDCHAVNPRLVYGRMTGWGQHGPMAERAGHDLNYLGLSGAAWYASDAGQPPFPPPTMLGDIGGGALYLVTGMLAAILKARETGRGTVVDAAIYDGSAHMMNLLMALRQAGAMPEDRGTGLLDGPHWSRSYRTADGGHMTVQCLEPKFYAAFLDRLGLSDDPDFADQFDRTRWPALTARLAELFAGRTRAEWERHFAGSDACVAPVLSPDEAQAHAMNAARRTWHQGESGLQAAPAPRFQGDGAWSPPPIPARGAHDAEIRADLERAARPGGPPPR